MSLQVSLGAATLGAPIENLPVIGKWIRFEFCRNSDSGKTRIYDVVNKEFEIRFGTVSWYGPWRKYAFFPYEDMVFEQDCLNDVARFLNVLMEERERKA